MKTTNEKTKILNENDRVLSFIKKWQLKNDYNPKFSKEYNKKFNSEFNDFLENGNFSKETILMFKC